MALESIQQKRSFVAGADLSAKQFYFVKLSASNTVVLCAAATDVPIGVLQNTPTSGDAADVCVYGETKVSSAAALAAGATIGTNASGQGAAYVAGTDTTKYIVGQVTVASGAANGIASALIDCASPARGT
jgi:hypothetical protein